MRTSLVRVCAAPVLVVLVALAPATPVAAQDVDPAAEYIRQQEQIRTRQLSQVNGAASRAASPLHTPVPRSKAVSSPDTMATREASATPPVRPTRWVPWVLGGLAAAAALVCARVLRSAR